MKFRQGDVLIEKIVELPIGLQESKDMVLAYGEVTGHKHKLVGKSVQVFKDQKGSVFVKAGAGTQLVHEEHKPINLKEGFYTVEIQREYSPQENRKVMD